MHREYPILEFDPAPAAVIDPHRVIAPINAPAHCVVCFFQDVIDTLARDSRLTAIAHQKSEIGLHPIYELDIGAQRLALFHPGVGAPLAAAMLEEVIALGCRKFVACGAAGVLDSGIACGQIVLPTAAVRDEGTSYHYLPPGREVSPAPAVVAAIARALQQHHVEYVLGKTWTTDAVYRETPAKVQLRRSEGCVVVEMEAAALFAVAEFRHVLFGQLLYAGDDVGGAEWDERDWQSRYATRERLFSLAAEACLTL